MRTGVRGQPPVELVETAVRAHRRYRRREPLALGYGVVHVVAREHRESALNSERGKQIVLARVERAALVDQLDVHGIPAEQRDQSIELGCRRLRPARGQRAPHRAFAAPRQYRPVSVGLRGQLVEVVQRAPLLGTLQLPVRDGGREPVVSLFAAREDEQVRARGIGFSTPRRARGSVEMTERELGAKDGLHLQGLGGFGEAHDAVEPVVVGDREGVQAEPLGLFGELFGRGGPVEERERRVGVQLGVRHHVGGTGDRLRHVWPALARPGRAVAAVGVRGNVTGAPLVAEQPLHLRPRDGRVVKAHQSYLASATQPSSSQTRSHAV